MESFVCLDCLTVGTLNVRGNCGTCNSAAVSSVHAQYLASQWNPSFTSWMEDAQKTLAALQ